MVDESSTHRSEPLADLITLAAGPIAAVIRSFDQLRRGSEELIRAVENFNTTMTKLNETAARVNRLLDDVEEPVRAMIPQITRTVQHGRRDVEAAGRADRSGGARAQPARRHAERADHHVVPDRPQRVHRRDQRPRRRLSPLGQIAESAGGMFGLRIPGHDRARPRRRPPRWRRFMVAPPPPRDRRRRRRRRRRLPAKKAPATEGGGEEGAGAEEAGGQALLTRAEQRWNVSGWRRTAWPRPSRPARCRARRS